MLDLADAYSVSISAHAVMSNHLHVVLKVDAQAAEGRSDEEVARPWGLVFPGSDEPEAMAIRIANIASMPEQIALYQERELWVSFHQGFFSSRLAGPPIRFGVCALGPHVATTSPTNLFKTILQQRINTEPHNVAAGIFNWRPLQSLSLNHGNVRADQRCRAQDGRAISDCGRCGRC